MQRKELDCISRRQCLRLGLCGQLHLPWWPQCWGDVHSDSPGLLEDMLLMLFSTWEVFSSIYCSWSETFWNFPLTAPNITILRVWLHAAVYRKYFWLETFSLGSGKLLKELFFPHSRDVNSFPLDWWSCLMTSAAGRLYFIGKIKTAELRKCDGPLAVPRAPWWQSCAGNGVSRRLAFPVPEGASGLSYLQNAGEVVLPLKHPSEQVASNFRTRRPCGTGPVRGTQWVLSVIMGTSLFSSDWHPSFPSLLNCLILPYLPSWQSAKAVIGEEYMRGRLQPLIPIGLVFGFQNLSSCFRKKPAKN